MRKFLPILRFVLWVLIIVLLCKLVIDGMTLVSDWFYQWK